MKTIEQLEVEIGHKSTIIDEGLKEFNAHIDMLGQVIGKDPTYVYQVLANAYEDVITQYETTTRRNVEILSGYIVKLDKIMNVLDLVHEQIAKIKQADEEGTLEEVSKEIEGVIDDIAGTVEQVLEEEVDVKIERDYIKMAVIGVGSYALLRILGLNNLASMIGGGVAAYLLVGPEVKAEETLHAIEVANT